MRSLYRIEPMMLTPILMVLCAVPVMAVVLYGLWVTATDMSQFIFVGFLSLQLTALTVLAGWSLYHELRPNADR